MKTEVANKTRAATNGTKKAKRTKRTKRLSKEGQEWFESQYSNKKEIYVSSKKYLNFFNEEKLDLIDSLKIEGKIFTKLENISLKKIKLTRLEISDCSQLNKIELSELGKLGSLEIVNCSKLDKIELSELGKLTRLKIINCSKLDDIELSELDKLTSLKIINCSQLKKITDLYELPKLTNLSVRGCLELTTLDCSSTELTELEVSDLIKLNCSNTLIKELCLNLCPDIKKLDCSNNKKLVNLDVSNCSKLKFLDCTGSELTILDLTNCPKLLKELKNKESSTSTITKSSKVNLPPNLNIIQERETKNILIVGRTGGGKSTLANVLTGTDEFKESAYAISETKNFKKKGFEYNKKEYCVVDTIGVGDTQLSTRNVLYKIAEGILSMPEGISQVFFVIDGRFTKEEINTFNTIRDSVFKIGILKHVTIVRTKFTNFRNTSEREKDKEKMRKENEEIADIINSCKDVIHVDNPSTSVTADDDIDLEEQNKINEKARKRSRKILIDHLEKVLYQNDYFKLENWDELHRKIDKYIKDNNIKELENDQELLGKLENDQEFQAIIKLSKAFCFIQ